MGSWFVTNTKEKDHEADQKYHLYYEVTIHYSLFALQIDDH